MTIFKYNNELHLLEYIFEVYSGILKNEYFYSYSSTCLVKNGTFTSLLLLSLLYINTIQKCFNLKRASTLL